VLCSCGTTYQIKKGLKQSHKETSYFKGFVLYNPTTKKEIVNHNGAKYFTPASNTKLYTFYTAFRALKDSVKSLAYYQTNDSLIIKGTADPSFLYGFKSHKVLDFLRKSKDTIYLVDASIDETPLGSGWAWDDYPYYYMPEKSLFPMYGNIVTYKKENDSLTSYPSFFKNKIRVLDSVSLTRELSENQFYLQKDRQKEKEVPFIISNNLIAQLLSDTIHKEVNVIPNSIHYNYELLTGIPYDSLFKKMLVVSDNFIAEQLMLQVGKEVADSFSVEAAIEYSLSNYLQDLPQKPRWVDGSGLSRYNLFTPEDMVFLLEKMFKEIPLQKLLDYFPVGGESGTLKNWYANEKPFVYAKSGSLSNNYNLSGYLITKKGTLLIFSYMNNHYRKPTSEVKKGIEKILKEIYSSY
jgi:D-alanyl-D-alanine carboxypeptidase/D-alanyl-D-alanine-endopeptidase (penicillin-binding protein 4)